LTLWFSFHYVPKVKTCESNITISREYYMFIKNENILDSVCYFQNKILKSNDYKYLNNVYNIVDKEHKFLHENTEYYLELIIRSERTSFIRYFNRLNYQEKFKILSLLKLQKNKEAEVLLNELKKGNISNKFIPMSKE